MTQAFAHLRQLRNNMIGFFEKHESKAHIVPEGFNNTLYWNFAHCVVTQQLLCYKLAGKQMKVSDELIDKYKKGTSAPLFKPSEAEVKQVKLLALSLVYKMEADFNAGFFQGFSEYTTSFKVTLNSIDEAILFNNVHEGLHFGYMMAMVKK